MQARRLLLALAWLSAASASTALARSGGEPTRLWFDADGDERPDLYVFAPGADDVLLRNAGDGTFDDVTAASGLSGLRSSRVAVADLDGDGDRDLARLTAEGALRLHLDVGQGAYEDVTEVFGLAALTATRIEWTDYDGDGRQDLELGGAGGATRLFHNRGGLAFDEVVLRLPAPQLARSGAPVPAADPASVPGDQPELGVVRAERPAPLSAASPAREAALRRGTRAAAGRRGSDPARQPVEASGSPLGPVAQVFPCAPSLADTGLGLCLEGSSAPELGKLYPLSQELLVRPGGEVTIGLDPASTPFGKLHVDGGAWFQEPAFFNAFPSLSSAAVTAYGAGSLYRGYMGVDGSFVPFFSGAWNGRDVGVAGISLDSGISDNYGILGRSNNKALRAENDAFVSNWAELGTRNEGLIASGTSTAATFLNTTETYGEGYYLGGVRIGGSGPFSSGDQLHVRSANDAVIRIEADTDNFTETDQPALILSQDGGQVTASLTFANGTNAVLLDSPYAFGEMYFRQFDENTAVNDWEFQNFTDVEARITDLGNLQLDGSVSSPATDLAEYYPLAEPVEPGDVVAFVGEGLRLVRALDDGGGAPRLAGIVSSKPGLLLGLDATDESSTAVPVPPMGDDERYVGLDPELQVDREVLHEIEHNARAPLALCGRVPCKVSAENGPIRPGDLLGASRLPGHAARAVGAGTVVGTALQSLESGTGTIVVLVGLGRHAPDSGPALRALERRLDLLQRRLATLAGER